jgi:hypothetical protein
MRRMLSPIADGGNRLVGIWSSEKVKPAIPVAA